MNLNGIDLKGESILGEELIPIASFIDFLRSKLGIELLATGIESLNNTEKLSLDDVKPLLEGFIKADAYSAASASNKHGNPKSSY